MDRFALMNSFVAVSKSRSFSGAARRLGASPSMVSRHVALLEDDLGVRLMNRTARSISLTEAGRSYLELSERVLQELAQEEASLRASHRRPEGVLSIVSPKWIGSLALADAVAEFALAHPMIKMSFDIGVDGDRPFGFVDQGYDAAFQTRDLPDSTVRVRRVATLPFVLCASPSYLQRLGAPVRLADLTRHQRLIHRAEPTWQLESDGEVSYHKVTHPAFTSNTYLVLRTAALRGLGIAMLPLWPVAEDLSQGRLQRVLPSHGVPVRPLFIAYPPGLQSIERLRLFIDFIGGWFRQSMISDTSLLEAARPGDVEAAAADVLAAAR